MSELLSIIIPVFNDFSALQSALSSIYEPDVNFNLEVIVVDDGSIDSSGVEEVCKVLPVDRLIRLSNNQGKASAVNAGIDIAIGQYTIQLDADDKLVSGWPKVFSDLLELDDFESDLILTSCVTPDCQQTQEGYPYDGPLTYEGRLRNEHRGEYLAVFKTSFVKELKYVDLGIKNAGYEEYSYLRFIKHGACRISSKILRIYQRSSGGLSDGWWRTKQAQDRVKHLEVLLKEYGEDFRNHAPVEYKRKLLRLSVYEKFAGESPGLRSLLAGFHPKLAHEFLGCLLLMMGGKTIFYKSVHFCQSIGLLRRWG